MAAFVNTKWHNPSAWKREGMSSRCFLDPKNKAYPVKLTPNGPYYVRALTAATHYAKLWNDKPIAAKAERLLKEYDRLRKIKRYDKLHTRKEKK